MKSVRRRNIDEKKANPADDATSILKEPGSKMKFAS
jgi:hypothetical protein